MELVQPFLHSSPVSPKHRHVNAQTMQCGAKGGSRSLYAGNTNQKLMQALNSLYM